MIRHYVPRLRIRPRSTHRSILRFGWGTDRYFRGRLGRKLLSQASRLGPFRMADPGQLPLFRGAEALEFLEPVEDYYKLRGRIDLGPFDKHKRLTIRHYIVAAVRSAAAPE